VPAADPAAMAQQIIALASDPALARRMGQAARARVLERFSMQAMVAAYQQVYDRQLERRG